MTTRNHGSPASASRGIDRTTRIFVIVYAIVEAVLIGYFLFARSTQS